MGVWGRGTAIRPEKSITRLTWTELERTPSWLMWFFWKQGRRADGLLTINYIKSCFVLFFKKKGKQKTPPILPMMQTQKFKLTFWLSWEGFFWSQCPHHPHFRCLSLHCREVSELKAWMPFTGEESDGLHKGTSRAPAIPNLLVHSTGVDLVQSKPLPNMSGVDTMSSTPAVLLYASSPSTWQYLPV